jgi:putative membrane protein
MTRYFAPTLAVAYLLFSIVLGINPVYRAVWIVEIIPVTAIFIGLITTYKHFQFSHTAYVLMAFGLFWHTLGAHYTFANVPFHWFNDFIGSERNQFDRIGHFSAGFFAYAMCEWLLRKKYCGSMMACVFSLFFIMSIAAGYEIIEWCYAELEGGNAGAEFLGAQGDIWDAQKDMLADTLGAICSLLLFYKVRPDQH